VFETLGPPLVALALRFAREVPGAKPVAAPAPDSGGGEAVDSR